MEREAEEVEEEDEETKGEVEENGWKRGDVGGGGG